MVLLMTVAAVTLSNLPQVQAGDMTDIYGYHAVTPLEADAILKENPDIIVLDVRKPEEFNLGHIPGAININYFADDFDDRIASLDPSKRYLLHCKSGGRSGNTMPLMRANGITDVRHLEAGFDGWLSEGLQTEKP
jgi:rhodanese-related sulfurtransferase